ncbi:MAG: hypothetical protein ACREMH_11295 [Gemmatimonadales bacterium]
MRIPVPRGAAAALALLFPLAAVQAQNPESQAAFIKAAEEGGPAHISAAAAVARMEPNGALTPLRPGSNGFTCTILPDGTNAPVCLDANGLEFMKAAFSGAPKPTNTAPGIAYMAKGGKHFENAKGESVMKPSADTKEVDEPPHWMILWPIDAAASGLPTKPNSGGSYVMFAGTPYAHLMVYQDPKRLKN